MLLKRKRSIDAPSSPSIYQSTTYPSTSSAQYDRLDSTPSTSTSSPTSHPNLNSRTQKRYRDNRPSEDTIHAATLQKLYAAQRQHPNAEPVMSAPIEPLHGSQQDRTHRAQSSLHSFWRIPSAQNGAILHDPGVGSSARAQEARCEDCDAPMQDGDDEMMGGSGDDYTMTGMTELEAIAHKGGGYCSNCGKRVCGLCSLVRDRRTCLQCAGG